MPANPSPALKASWFRFRNNESVPSWIYGLLAAGVILGLPSWFGARVGAHAFWPYWLAIIPAALIYLQSLYMLRLPKPELAESEPAPPDLGHAAAEAERVGREEAETAIDVELGWSRVLLEYAPPIAANLLAGMLVAFMVDQLAIPAPDPLGEISQLECPEFTCAAFEGAVYGALGAYVYVLMMLGQRTYQRDITPGAAVWSAVQLFLGPLLGGLIATILDKNDSVQIQHYTRAAVYFFAGLSPREIVQFVQSTVRRFFEAPPPLRKAIPLQQIRGIDARVEERLYEEGITDVHQLATANPVRLYRSTPFDLRQVVTWMDECILYTTLPVHAETLQKLGVTGAIDLAYYWNLWLESAAETPPAEPAPPEETRPTRRRGRGEAADTPQGGPGGESPEGAGAAPQPGVSHGAQSIALIAQRLGMEKELFLDIIRRLNEDTQVRLIWSLYQAFESADARTTEATPETATEGAHAQQ